ncbi:hypothetical protein J6590_023799, partial [Homalodisca vitripennis]
VKELLPYGSVTEQNISEKLSHQGHISKKRFCTVRVHIFHIHVYVGMREPISLDVTELTMLHGKECSGANSEGLLPP